MRGDIFLFTRPLTLCQYHQFFREVSERMKKHRWAGHRRIIAALYAEDPHTFKCVCGLCSNAPPAQQIAAA